VCLSLVIAEPCIPQESFDAQAVCCCGLMKTDTLIRVVR